MPLKSCGAVAQIEGIFQIVFAVVRVCLSCLCERMCSYYRLHRVSVSVCIGGWVLYVCMIVVRLSVSCVCVSWYVGVNVCLFMTVYVCVYVLHCVYLSVSVCMYVCISVYLSWYVGVDVCLFVIAFCLSVCLSLHLSFYVCGCGANRRLHMSKVWGQKLN